MNIENEVRIEDLEDDMKDALERIAAIESRLGRLNLEVEGYMNDRFVPIEHRIAALIDALEATCGVKNVPQT